MKDYKQLIKELPSNTIVCAVGEFNPPTVGHELLVKTVKKLAEQKHSAHVIYTSPSKNSLIQEDKKAHYLNLMFPKISFKSLNESNLQEVITELHKKYKKIILVVGTDQITEMRKLQNVEIIPVDKDPEADYTKMKQFASKGIYEEFKKKLPSTIRDIDGKRLMNEMRTGLGLEPIKEQIVFVKDKLREKYFRGEIFNEGDIVESNGEKFTIVKRGSNHLLLKEATGKLISKWIQDVKPTEEKEMNESKLAEGAIQPNGTDKIDTKTSEPMNSDDKTSDVKVKKGVITFFNYTKAQNIKEQKHKGTESQADHRKDNESDIDAEFDSHQADKREVGHTLVSPGGQDNLRRRKVKYHLGEASALEKFRAAAAEREKKHDDIEAKRKADAEQGKENMSGSIDRLEKHLNKESAMHDIPNTDRTDKSGIALNPFRKQKTAADLARISKAKQAEKNQTGLYKKQSPAQRKSTVNDLMKLVNHLGESDTGMDLAKKIHQKAMTSYDKESGHENTAQHIATNPEHTAKQKKIAQSFLSRMQGMAEATDPAEKAAKETAKASLMAKQAAEKEALTNKQAREKEALKESHVEFRLDHREKATGDVKSTFADHEAKVSDTTDKATYVKVPAHKADAFKSAMKSKHGTKIELAESNDHYEKAEQHKDDAESAKESGDTFSYHMHMADHHGSLADWHYSKGRNDAGDKHAEKAGDHEMAAHAIKEDFTFDEKTRLYKKFINGKWVVLSPNTIVKEQIKDKKKPLAGVVANAKPFDPFFEDNEYDQTIDVATPNTPVETSEEDDIDDAEIEAMIGNLSDEEIMDEYDEENLALVDNETGEEIPKSAEEDALDEQALMEVLSRAERMKAKFRIRRTASKRERATKIALKRYSNTATINKRARRLAIKLMKQRMLRGRDPAKISVGEKERIERMLEKRKAVIGRIATRLAPRVRKVEKARMSHTKYTQGSQPSVF